MPDLERILKIDGLSVEELFYQLMLEETHERWLRRAKRRQPDDEEESGRS